MTIKANGETVLVRMTPEEAKKVSDCLIVFSRGITVKDPWYQRIKDWHRKLRDEAKETVK